MFTGALEFCCKKAVRKAQTFFKHRKINIGKLDLKEDNANQLEIFS